MQRQYYQDHYILENAGALVLGVTVLLHGVYLVPQFDRLVLAEQDTLEMSCK